MHKDAGQELQWAQANQNWTAESLKKSRHLSSEPVPVVSSDSFSWLMGVEPNVVFTAVAHLPQHSPCCVFRDTFLFATTAKCLFELP